MIGFLPIILTAASINSAQAVPSPALAPIAPEKQVFTIKFIDTTAGEAEFESLPPTIWQGQPANHMRASVRTVGLFWFIYPYVQTANVYLDPMTDAPLYVDINVQDRKKKQHTQIRLDRKTMRGEEIEDSTEPGRDPSHRRKQWNIIPDAQSIFSILNFVRRREMAVGKQLIVPVSHDEKNGAFQAEVLRAETVRAAGADRQAVVLRVNREFTDHFYSTSVKEEPLFWFSNDGTKKLLRFEFKHRRGKVIAILKSST